MTFSETASKSSEPTPEARLVEIEEAARLARTIERLPSDMRTAVVHRVFLERSWEEVARTLGKSPGAARVLWTRALKKLHEWTAGS